MSEKQVQSSREELIELLSNLVSIESENPPGNEKEVATFIKSWFEEENIDTKLVHEPFEDRPQVVAEVGSGSPRLILNGHTDVYPAGDRSRWEYDPYSGEVDNGKLYGRGSADMKLGVTLAMLTARDLKEDIESGSLEGSLMVQAPIGQEAGEPGTKTLIDEGYTGDYAVVLEPTKMHTVTSHKGLAWYDITVRGEPGHSARPDEGVNAIEESNPVIERLIEYDNRLRNRTHELVGKAYANVTEISGGLTGNMIPEETTIRLERRFFPEETLADIDDEIDGVLQKIRDEQDLTMEWERVRHYESTDGPADTRPAEVFRSHSAEIADVPTEPAGRPWAADTRWFVNHTDIPAITWGPGDSRQCGRYDEHVILNEAETGLGILQRAARELITADQTQ